MEKKNYKVIIEQDCDGVYVADVPELPGCHTHAKDLPTLYERLREVIELCEEVYATDTKYKKLVKSFGYTPMSIRLENFVI